MVSDPNNPIRMNIYEISSLVMNILRDDDDDEMTSSGRHNQDHVSLSKMTGAGLASLMLGVSLALMVCGSIIFVIGFLLMPWVFGFVFLFYIVGIVTSFLMLFRAVFYHAFASKKGGAGYAWKLL